MIQVNPYKPQKMSNPIKPAEEKPVTLDDYARVAGIKPRNDHLKPYMDLYNQQKAQGGPKLNMTSSGNLTTQKPMTSVQMAQVSQNGGTPEFIPTGSLTSRKKTAAPREPGIYSVAGIDPVNPKPPTKLEDYIPAYNEYARSNGLVEMNDPNRPVTTNSSEDQRIRDEYLKIAAERSGKNYDQYNQYEQGYDDAYGGDFDSFDSSGLDSAGKEIYDIDSDHYRAAKAAEENARAAAAEIERKKSIQLQQAYINSEMAKKYLDVYLKQSGMGGLGASQSTLAQLGNDYQNNVSGINSGYDEENRAIRQQYLEAARLNEESRIQAVRGKKEEQRLELINLTTDEFRKNLSRSVGDSANVNKDGSLNYTAYENLYQYLLKNQSNLGSQYLYMLRELEEFKPNSYEKEKKITEAINQGKTINIDGVYVNFANGEKTRLIGGYYNDATKSPNFVINEKDGREKNGSSYYAYNGKYYVIVD